MAHRVLHVNRVPASNKVEDYHNKLSGGETLILSTVITPENDRLYQNAPTTVYASIWRSDTHALFICAQRDF